MAAKETHKTVWQGEWRGRLADPHNPAPVRREEIADHVRMAAGALLDAAAFDVADVTIEQTSTKLVVTLQHHPAEARKFLEERDARLNPPED